MAFIDRSDLLAAEHENGINATIGQLMLQRPSMFNYATILFTQALSSQFCVLINTPPGGGPLFTVEPQLPVLGAPRPLGLDWCLQLTNVSVDLYPGNTLTLPPELDPIGRQQFALHLRACFGLACPDDRVVENLTAEMEAAVATSMLPASPTTGPATSPAGGGGVQPAPTARSGQARDVQPVPSANVLCSCLEAFGVGHFERGAVAGVPGQWLKTRLDSLEIVDLVTVPPTNLEDMLECYLRVVLRLGVLPRLIVPMENLVLDITRMLQGNGTAIGQHVTVVPAAVPPDVPANPAVDHDQLKVFFNLKVD
ncbi:MAG: hypothetical protein ACRDPF_18135 [Streptosporangiaceae bacterium]